MNGMVSCEYNMDSGCIELKFVDGTEIAIDCTAVENLTANNMYERFELDYLIYNGPARLCGLDPEWQPGNISESRYSM